MSAAPLSSLYTVKPGDTLASIADFFYGTPARYLDIVRVNRLGPDHKLVEGQRLRIPRVPAHRIAALSGVDLEEIQITAQRLPLMTDPVATDATTGRILEEVTVTAKRPWYQDWKIWAGVGSLALAALWFSTRRKST